MLTLSRGARDDKDGLVSRFFALARERERERARMLVKVPYYAAALLHFSGSLFFSSQLRFVFLRASFESYIGVVMFM